MIPLDGEVALLDVKMLLLFETLYETRSVTGCAERLGWSQPTVSVWLKRLRSVLQDPLFVRTPSGMQPTSRAEALIGTCRAALVSIRRLGTADTAFDPATARRTFRICMMDASQVTLLPRLLRRIQDAAPQVRIEADRIGSDVAEALLAGDADLAIGLLPKLESGFYQQTLYTENWVCLVRKDHPRIGGELTLQDYAAEGHVSVASGASRRLLEETLKAARLERRIMLELPGFLGVPATLAVGDLIATLPRLIGRTLGKAADLRVLNCPISLPSYEIRQHWHERYHHDPASQWLRGLCADLFQREFALEHSRSARS
ncbi:LysR family transcriptional regulator [Mesorhizobium silamurunense]|uniref:LysR family transcriptional regulator n=1 Tax=Mesorhizobium silamurunense TaxID=499528 RepID=UPI00177BCB9B|nr:LysR family transcriptional regulator [Mesorhizobium silamurunense]